MRRHPSPHPLRAAGSRPVALAAAWAAGVLLSGAAPAAAVTAPDSEHSLPAYLPLPALRSVPPARIAPLPSGARFRSAFPGEGWQARLDPRTGAVLQAWGPGIPVASSIPNDAEAERHAREFLAARSDLLETRPAEMVLLAVRRALGKTSVRFGQEIGGLRVHGAEAFVLLTDAGAVAAFGSTFVPAPAAVARARLSDRDALREAAASMGAHVAPHRPTETDRLLVLAAQGETFAPVPAWRVRFETDRPFGRWEVFLDARDGSVLGRRSRVRSIDVVGTVQVRPEPAGPCGPPQQTVPAASLTVQVIGGSSSATGSNGSFTVPHTGALPVLVRAQLKGTYVNVTRYPTLGTDAVIQGPATPGVPINLLFDSSNSLVDERDVYHHSIVAHDFIKSLDPTLTQMDFSLGATVGRIDALCPGNAWYDNQGMHFCQATSTYGNTARMETVVYHEYGHGVTDAVYSRNGGTLSDPGVDEGNSDVIANFISRSSILGKGWFTGDCSSYLRESSNTLIYPDDLAGGTGHQDGRIIAGFHWDLWQSLLGAMPAAQADSIAFHTWHAARDLGAPQDMPSQVLWTFLADDDDGNLGDGTPHFEHLCLAAGNHGFECPEPSSQVVITHPLHPHVTDGSQPFDITATVRSTTGTIVPASVTLSHRVNGRGFVTVPMTPTGNPDEYAAQIPPQPAMAQIEYYLSAADDQEHFATSPNVAPTDLHAFDVAWMYDPAESPAGWTMGQPGDDATSGAWVHDDPVGTLAQPEDDASRLPGQVSCFLTGQCAVGSGTCWSGCTLGCNDVDGGATTLLSPVYDVSGAGSAILKYDRWFSNDVAANPAEDVWTVEVSNDGGGAWTTVENTTASDAAWRSQEFDLVALFGTPAQIRLRFTVSDRLNPSLVEAAVDDVRILAAFGPAVDADVAVAPVPRLELAQNRPNPGGPGTQIEYALPEPSRVRLAIYDVRGRAVRELVSGNRPAGPGLVRWDGRDAAGQRVAPGVYFYRLTASSGSLTRKMTVAP
jgi:hypothetical protein